MPVSYDSLDIRDSLTRQLGILKFLSTHSEVSIAELARQFGVDPQTINQDIEELSCCSLPTSLNEPVEDNLDIYKVGDKVVFHDSQQLDVDLRLTPFEISAILLVLSSLKQKPEMWDQDTVASLREKLEAALRHSPIIIDVDVDKPQDRSAILVKEGIDKGKQLEFDYLDIDSGTLQHRLVDPVTFFSHDGHYYLLCWDITVADSRRFRTDRMRNVTMTATDATDHPDIHFDQLDPFDLRNSKEATIKVKENCTWILDYILLKELKRKLRKDGTYTAVIKYFNDEWLIKWAIENRDRITVESPSSIVHAIEDRVSEACVRYGVN